MLSQSSIVTVTWTRVMFSSRLVKGFTNNTNDAMNQWPRELILECSSHDKWLLLKTCTGNYTYKYNKKKNNSASQTGEQGEVRNAHPPITLNYIYIILSSSINCPPPLERGFSASISWSTLSVPDCRISDTTLYIMMSHYYFSLYSLLFVLI